MCKKCVKIDLYLHFKTRQNQTNKATTQKQQQNNKQTTINNKPMTNRQHNNSKAKLDSRLR